LTQAQFKEIFDTHFDSVRNYIWYRSGDTELATDVAQETFMKIWEKQPAIVGSKIKGLLFKIAGDLFISQYRKQKTAMNFKLNINTELTGQTPEDVLQFEELSTQYNKALKQLPEKQRIVFLMSRIDEMKYHEIAENLGLSVKAVEKRMKHALDSLKQALQYT
jgi:RNA polymerase sigma-70 factor (ECF subfamily)